MSAQQQSVSSSNSVGGPTIGKWTAQRELVQGSLCSGWRGRYQLFNDRHLSVEIRQFGLRSRSHWVDLRYVDPQPQPHSRVAWGWLGLAALLGGGGVLLLAVLAFAGGPLVAHPVFPGAVAAVIGGAVALWTARVCSSSSLVWHTMNGHAPVMELVMCRSGRRQARAFVEEVKVWAVRARSQASIDPAALLSGEMREHRRLRVEGVLGVEDYEAAKERILELHGAAQNSQSAQGQAFAPASEHQETWAA